MLGHSGVCDKADYSNCLLGPAYPISPEDNFGTTADIPKDFVDNENTYYYLSRFAFAFCLIALAFSGLAFIIDILGFCFEIIDKVVIFLITIGLLFWLGLLPYKLLLLFWPRMLSRMMADMLTLVPNQWVLCGLHLLVYSFVGY